MSCTSAVLGRPDRVASVLSTRWMFAGIVGEWPREELAEARRGDAVVRDPPVLGVAELVPGAVLRRPRPGPRSGGSSNPNAWARCTGTAVPSAPIRGSSSVIEVDVLRPLAEHVEAAGAPGVIGDRPAEERRTCSPKRPGRDDVASCPGTTNGCCTACVKVSAPERRQHPVAAGLAPPPPASLVRSAGGDPLPDREVLEPPIGEHRGEPRPDDLRLGQPHLEHAARERRLPSGPSDRRSRERLQLRPVRRRTFARSWKTSAPVKS